MCGILFSNFKKASVGELEINPSHAKDSVAGVLLASCCFGAISGKGAARFIAAAVAHRVTVRKEEAPSRVLDQTVSPKAGQNVSLLFTKSLNRQLFSLATGKTPHRV